MFIPQRSFNLIKGLLNNSNCRSTVLPDIKLWLSVSRAHTEAVVEKDRVTRQLNKKILTGTEWRRVSNLFNGVGKDVMNKYGEEVEQICHILLKVKADHLRKREETYNLERIKLQNRVKVQVDKDLFVKLFKVKKELVEETWRMTKINGWRKIEVLEKEKGIKIVERTRAKKNVVVTPTDQELKVRFGEVDTNDPIVYGEVELTENEKKVLRLPPKFSLTEEIDIKDLDLELRKSAVKGRWHHMNKEDVENEGINNSVNEDEREANEIIEIIESQPYLKGGNYIDFSKRKATDLKHNARLYMPKPIKNGQFEIRFKNFEMNAIKIAKDMRESQVRNKKEKFFNLDADKQKGLKSLLLRRKREGVVVFETDKSGKLSVDNKDNFSEKMKIHLKGEDVSKEDCKEILRVMNIRAKVWSRIMSTGASWGHEDRAKSAVTTSTAEPPVIYGLRKDHKEVKEDEEHPLRPVCGATCGPNCKHSEQIAKIIEPFNNEVEDETWVSSTEELLAHMQEFNEKEYRELLEAYSMDADALFPSILVRLSALAVKELVLESKLQLRSINKKELQRYLPYICTEDELITEGLQRLVMRRKFPMARGIKITGKELEGEWSNEKSIWLEADIDPDEKQVKLLFAVALQKEVEYILFNHVYRFGEKILKQKEGGSIGSVLTCVLAKTRMIKNMRKLRERINQMKWVVKDEKSLRSGDVVIKERQVVCKEIKLRVKTTYVDDLFMVSTRIEKGWRYIPGRRIMLWSKEAEEEDRGVESDRRTALVMKDIANDLDPDIKMKIDTPSMNDSGRLPVLDLEIWMRYENGKAKLSHCYYEKPMSTKFVIHKDSALSWNTKKNALVGEVRRRLLNCSEDVREVEGKVIIDKFCYKMLTSGYNIWERNLIVTQGIASFKNLIKMSEEGKRPLYRLGSWKKLERNIDKIRKTKTWYGKDTETVLFVQATKNELLRKELQREADKCGLRVKVVEKGGKSLKSLLQRSDISPQMSCGYEDCVICKTKEDGRCGKENCGYKIYCKRCKTQLNPQGELVPAEMHGESSRCARVRCGEHYAALRRGKNSNLFEHVRDFHNGDESVEFGFEVTGLFQRDTLGRQLEEAMRIESFGGTRMNDKEEWVQPASITVGAYRTQY